MHIIWHYLSSAYQLLSCCSGFEVKFPRWERGITRAQQSWDLGIELCESFHKRFSCAARVEDRGLKEKARTLHLSPGPISRSPLVQGPVFTPFTLQSRKLKRWDKEVQQVRLGVVAGARAPESGAGPKLTKAHLRGYSLEL